MKKKKLVVYVLLVVMLLSACSTKETPSQAVKTALTAIKKTDLQKIRQYFGTEDVLNNNGDEKLEGEKFSKLLFKNLDFKVLSSEENGDHAVVKTEITNTDMSLIFGEYFIGALGIAFDDQLTEEEVDKKLEDLLVALLSRPDNELKTTVVNINLTKEDNGWLLESSEELLDAIMGGLNSALEDFD